jgi:hypothetical protein
VRPYTGAGRDQLGLKTAHTSKHIPYGQHGCSKAKLPSSIDSTPLPRGRIRVGRNNREDQWLIHTKYKRNTGNNLKTRPLLVILSAPQHEQHLVLSLRLTSAHRCSAAYGTPALRAPPLPPISPLSPHFGPFRSRGRRGRCGRARSPGPCTPPRAPGGRGTPRGTPCWCPRRRTRGCAGSARRCAP